jgi:hypothetical protein
VKLTNRATPPHLNQNQAQATASVQITRENAKEYFERCTCTRQAVIIIACDGRPLSATAFFKHKWIVQQSLNTKDLDAPAQD